MTGSVMVSPLQDTPPNESTEEWLDASKRSANLNPIITEERSSVNGISALRVRYRNDRASVEMDVYYVVRGSKMYEISFTGKCEATPLEDLPNHRIYQCMVSTFELEGP